VFSFFTYFDFDVHLLSFLEDVFVVVMLYSFLKLILLSSLVELV